MMRKLLRKIYYRISPVQRLWVRRAVFWPLDLLDKWRGKGHPLVPPRGMIYTGSGDFLEQGIRFRNYFKQFAGLHPGSHVLDIGSGIGRMAAPLTEELDPEKGGSYKGFDVVESGVSWCQQHISKAFPHFQFTYVPLKNDLYRKDGEEAATFVFPYVDGQFDLVILTSVFTHMLPEEIRHYLGEIGRVVRPGGRVFATFFIWNDESARLSQQGDFRFPFDRGDHRLMDDRVVSANVAVSQHWLEAACQDSGLIMEKFLPGEWCGRAPEDRTDFQDIVVLKKP